MDRRAYQQSYYRELRKKRKAKGLCGTCGKCPPVSTKTLCQACLDKCHDWRTQKRSAGLCTSCGASPANGKVECAECRRKAKAYRDAIVANGMCRDCRIRPRVSKTRCEQCLEEARVYVKTKKKQAYEKLGGFVCACCQETEEAFLSIDHVNNDGAEKRRNGEGQSTQLFNAIIKATDTSSWQVLCMNCQMGKRIHGTCPHQSRKANG